MKALDFLKDIRNDCPEEWKALDEAIEELELLQSKLQSIESYCEEQIDRNDHIIEISADNIILDYEIGRLGLAKELLTKLRNKNEI